MNEQMISCCQLQCWHVASPAQVFRKLGCCSFVSDGSASPSPPALCAFSCRLQRKRCCWLRDQLVPREAWLTRIEGADRQIWRVSEPELSSLSLCTTACPSVKHEWVC